MTKSSSKNHHPSHSNHSHSHEDTTMTTPTALPPTTATSLVTPAETADPIAEPEAEANFHHYLTIALQIPADQVRSARVNFTNVVQNAGTGVNAVAPYRDQIAKIPGVSLDQIDAIDKIGRAYQFAVTQVDRAEPIPSDIRERLAKAVKLRAMLFAKVEVLVLDGIIPESEVANIRKGRGPIAIAGDCVALVALIRKYGGAIDGHVKIAPADLQIASDLGAQLLTELRSATAPARTKQVQEDVDARDRLWTLLYQTWEQHVWRAGAWVFGRDVDDHVPPLGSRRVSKSEPTAPAPTPAPSPAPTPAPTPAPVATMTAPSHETGAK